MIKVKEVIVVEGRYDKIKLSSILDATIIETNGFRIFSNEQTVSMLKILAKKCGIIIFTDSDFAGFRIRNYLKNKITEGKIYNAYLPNVEGKERRKTHRSKEGLLGVEGFDEKDILKSLSDAGVFSAEFSENKDPKVTSLDLFELGLSGGKNSKEKRRIILNKLCLPSHLSKSVLPDVISTVISREDFISLVENTFKEE